jgi:hypothetical protein
VDGAIEGWVSLDGSFRSVPPGRKGVRGGYPRVSLRFTLGYFRVFPPGRQGILASPLGEERLFSMFSSGKTGHSRLVFPGRLRYSRILAGDDQVSSLAALSGVA